MKKIKAFGLGRNKSWHKGFCDNAEADVSVLCIYRTKELAKIAQKHSDKDVMIIPCTITYNLPRRITKQ